LTGVQEIPGILKQVEPNQVNLQQGPKQLSSFVHCLEHSGAGEGRVCVESYVGFTEVLANEAGHKHELVTVDPDHLEILELLLHFNHFLRNLVVDELVGWP
jgi:hypothetical protein